MSGNIDFPRQSSNAPITKPNEMTSVYPGKKPPTPPRPGKRPSLPSLDSERKESFGPEDFPRTLKLDLSPDERGSDLEKLLCEMKLPQLVRITKSFVIPGCSTALNEGDLFLLHFLYDNPTVHATTFKGKNLRLPVYAKQKYEILPLDPRLDDMDYCGTKALMDADPLPAAVRVVEAHCSIRKDEDQEADEIIELHGFEQDEERGRLLIGMSGSSPIKYSTDLTTSRYTTMLYPDFLSMAEIIELKFPQRIRIPDEKKKFAERDFKEEKVLKLEKLSSDKCVVATRAGDNHIFSIPVCTPIELAHDPTALKDKQILDMFPALYPLVNTTWRLVDPTQEALKTSMEAIPQPIKQVLDAWFASEQGKSKACEVADKRVDNLKEEITITLNDMRRMKGELDFFRNKNSVLNLPADQPLPLRPPRTPPGKKLPCLQEQPDKEPPKLPPRPPNSRRRSDVSSIDGCDDDYEFVDEATKTFPKDTPSDLMNAVREILAKKEREVKEKTQQMKYWKKQYETVKKENESLKSAAPAIYEELPDFPEKPSGKSVPCDDYYLQPNPSDLKLRTRSLREYTVAQVGDFLRQLDLEKYIGTFRMNGINGSLLVELKDEHMLELEMSRLHALKLKLEIEKLELPPLPHR